MGEAPQVLYQVRGELEREKIRLSLSEEGVPIQERPRLGEVVSFWAAARGERRVSRARRRWWLVGRMMVVVDVWLLEEGGWQGLSILW
jgi:hypothetical protein